MKLQLENLPLETVIDILAKLSYTDIVRVGQANHGFHDICFGNLVWRDRLQRYYPEEYRHLSTVENLPWDGYYQRFKECYEKPFYVLNEKRETILITKTADPNKWQAIQKLYSLVMEGDFKAIDKFRKKSLDLPSALAESTILEMLLDNRIQNHERKRPLDWAATVEGQPLLNAAFQEALNNSSPEQDNVLRLLLEKHGYAQHAALFNKKLLLALILNQLAVVESDIDKLVDQPLTKNGKSALYIATENGHADLVIRLLAKKANANQALNGSSIFILAVRKGYLGVVQSLITAGVNVNQENDACLTPLYIAADNGHCEMVKLLIDAGANVEQGTADDDAAPLFVASQMGNLSTVKLLIQMRANVNRACRVNGMTPLYIAAQNRHLETLKFLIASGANKDLVSAIGVAPLHIAAQQGFYEGVATLIANGANVNQTTSKAGTTPLIYAALQGHLKLVQLLIENGADVDHMTTPNKLTALSAASKSHHPEIVSYLKKIIRTKNILKELDMVLNNQCEPNPKILDQAIVLFDWYVKQPFHKHNFHYKDVAHAIVNQLTDCKNTNSEFDETMLSAIISNAFAKVNADRSTHFFWKQPVSYRTLSDEGHFKIIEKLILEKMSMDASGEEDGLNPSVLNSRP
ncbi:MAG: ankyrin repeat domain-containing protein [Gammaproteobacteria bacterium]|nr:ankyrin repeat domain-containing protein [Gammaproteobacteria bacterium]